MRIDCKADAFLAKEEAGVLYHRVVAALVSIISFTSPHVVSKI